MSAYYERTCARCASTFDMDLDCPDAYCDECRENINAMADAVGLRGAPEHVVLARVIALTECVTGKRIPELE